MKELQPLKDREKLFTDFYVFDTETNGLRAKSDAFIFGVIYGHNFTKVLYSVDEFKKEFNDVRYKRKKVYAHNAEYDLNVIYDNIYELDRKAIFNGKFICCTNGNAMFADSMNIYPTSVKVIGSILGLEKQEIDNEYKEGTYKGIVTQKMIDYCIRDCEIVYNALYQIFQMVGSIKITLAGLSLDYFRRKFLKQKLVYNDFLSKYFFESYFGGRTEAFYIGKTNAYCYDMNSMYPDAMKYVTFPDPSKLRKANFCDIKIFVEKYLKYYEGVAYVKLFHEENYFGFLPYKKDNKLLFPCGTFEGWYNFNELRFAISEGVVKLISVYDIIYAEGVISPFIEFVDYNYNRRKNDPNELNKLIIKLLLNSLYGKFAQRIKSEMIYIENIEMQIGLIEEYEKEKTLIKIIPFNAERLDCFIEVKSNKGFLYNTIPVYSSYITSHARVKLLQNMLKYKEYKPLYCDTDSIFFEKLPPIADSTELGKFKRENKIVTEIRGLKNYTYIENEVSKDRIKGVPKNAIKTGVNQYEYSTLIKTRESIARNQIVGINTKRTKVLTMKYDKRIVIENGQTKAIILQMNK
jgi:hypothetical protein